MTMTTQDWRDLASVYRAGSARAAGWVMNTAMRQHAEVLEAQADRCDEIARERDGNPMVVHDHLHMHTGPDGRELQHRHKHSHGRGKADHDVHPVGHWHERDPFAPLEDFFLTRKEG